MKTRIYVEIPHQLPAKVYGATDDMLIALAYQKESQWIADKEYGDDGDIDIGQMDEHEIACEALGHDLHGFHCFDSAREAFECFSDHPSHQSTRVLALLEPYIEEEPTK